MSKYIGKRALPGRSKRPLLAVLALVLALTVGIGGTVAWVYDRTNSITNTFTLGSVDPGVDETFDGHTKEDVRAVNNGTVPAYIRVAVIPMWVEEGTEEAPVPVGEPISLEDLDIEWNKDGSWVKNGDYYYHRAPVAANGGKTSILIESAEVMTPSNDYQLDLVIVADAIQAQPRNAVETAWGVTLDSNGNINGSSIG